MKKRAVSFFMLFVFIFTLNFTVCAETDAGKVYDYLKTTVEKPEFSSIGGEWTVIAQLRSGNTAPGGKYITDYISRVSEYVTENEKNGVLNERASTDNSRLILALSAAGADASDFNSVDLVSPLENISFVSSQGINADAYALIALDCKNYLPFSDAREKLISDMLKNEIETGGWSLDPKRGADVDVTAMVITALAPYYNKDENIKNSVDKALDTLSSLQLDNGGFKSWGTENCESCATVIIALSALGLDSKTDERFVKADGNVYSAMLSFSLPDGSFSHVKGKKSNLMASEQAAIAVCAYERYKSESTPLYDYSDIFIGSFCRCVINIIKTIASFFELISKFTA